MHSDSNRGNARLRTDTRNWNHEKLRGLRPSKLDGRIPWVIEPDISLWRKLPGDTNLVEYYNDPYTHMEFQLSDPDGQLEQKGAFVWHTKYLSRRV